MPHCRTTGRFACSYSKETDMGGIRAGDAAIGLLVAALGLVGLIQAAGATDNEIYVFGLSLLGFAVVFDFGLLKRHYDTARQWPEDGYNEAIVKKFLIASMFWGVVAFLVGVVLAAQLSWPALNLGISFTNFGRLRTVHSTAAIFAFG